MSSLPGNSPTDETAQPVPPRYWWLKRILAAAGVLIVALVLLRLWWGHEAERRLQAKIAEYRAAGQPVTIEDFQFSAVPDEENAAHFLMQAATVLVRPPVEDADVEDVYGDAEVVAQRADAVARWIAANHEALRLARSARSKQRIDWKLRFRSPAINLLLPQVSPQRQLAKFLCTTALYQHHSADDAAAVDTLHDVLAQANTLGGMRGVLISSLVAVSVDALAVGVIEEITPAVQVGDARQTGPVGVGRREQVRALIATLLDDEPLRESWRWAMYGERLMQLDCINLAVTTPGWFVASGAGGSFPAWPISRLLQPMFQLDGMLMMEYSTTAAQAAGADTYFAAQRLVPRYPAFRSGIERSAHVLSGILLPSLDRAVLLHFRAIAQRRMAAVALAIRMYELDHGQRPRALDELVPEYLAAVPRDPFASDERSLGYCPNAPKPVLYSAGSDGIDDGGEYALRESGSIDWDAKDLVFFLNGDRPHAPRQPLATQPAATQAVEDEGDEVSDEGQADEDQAAADTP